MIVMNNKNRKQGGGSPSNMAMGINYRCFYICMQFLVVALSAIFSSVDWFDIISSVGLLSFIQLIVDQHIKCF